MNINKGNGEDSQRVISNRQSPVQKHISQFSSPSTKNAPYNPVDSFHGKNSPTVINLDSKVMKMEAEKRSAAKKHI